MTRAVLLALFTAALVAGVARPEAAARPRKAAPKPPRRPAEGPAERAAGAAPLPVFRKVPAFSYPDQHGHPTTDAALLGHPWIADFIFTRCTTACPILSARMVMLQRKISDPNIRFVSFSVDPAHDTPAVLKAYATRWRLDETRWHLLSTDQRTLPAFTAGLAITADETGDPDDPIVHSDGFLLIDAAGFVRGAYGSDDPHQLKHILADLEALGHSGGGGQPAPVPTTVTDGEKLFVELGCRGCHADAKVATPLGGLLGSLVHLSDGRTIKADEAYLRESILDPGAKTVDGYPASMPSYAGQVSEGQLASLLSYLKKLPGTRSAAPSRQLSIDPVCKMEVSAGADTPHVEHHGKTYWFCSESCRQKFSKTPQHYESP